MKNLLFRHQWGWRSGGIALGCIFVLAVALVKPIGVSTQFVIVDGIIWNAVSDDIVVPDSSAKNGYASPNAYLNKSGGKYAKNVANPLNYSLVFVVSMLIGGFIARRLQANKTGAGNPVCPAVWSGRFGNSPLKRHLACFLGGVLVLLGARLAGGCTSGHMMSGMMQTSLSGYVFALGAFAVAVPVAVFIYRTKE